MYKPIQPIEEVQFGEGKVRALASWNDGYQTISAVEDDRCVVFVLSDGRTLRWIPREVIETLHLERAAQVDMESA